MSHRFRVQCECGCSFMIPQHLEGRKGVCPRCDQEILLSGQRVETPSTPSANSLPKPIETPTLMGEDFHASLSDDKVPAASSGEFIPSLSDATPESNNKANDYIQKTLEEMDQAYEENPHSGESDVHKFVFDDQKSKKPDGKK